MIENNMVDVSDLYHPIGNFMLSSCNGKDITRELYGLKSFYYSSESSSYIKDFKYNHSPHIINMLKSHVVVKFPFTHVITENNSRRMTRETLDVLYEY